MSTANGAKLFKQRCAQCHTLNQVGFRRRVWNRRGGLRSAAARAAHCHRGATRVGALTAKEAVSGDAVW